MMNNVSIIGRLTKDPEVRYTTTNKAVSEFTIACNRLGEGADFITCQCWGNLAENLNKYQKKGNLIAVSGRLTTSNYENNEGKKIYKTYVFVKELEYLNSKGKNEKVEQDKDEFEGKSNCEVIRDVMENNQFEEFAQETQNLPF